MKKIIKILNEKKLVILIATSISVIGIVLVIIFLNRKINTKVFDNNYYLFSYDTKWSISKKSGLQVNLKNGSKGTLGIQSFQIEDEYKYLNIADFIDDILYGINEQNKTYKLISQSNDKITKYSYDGYKFLYEGDSSQTMVVVTKIGDKMLLFNYEAKNKYFDILIDSVENIIYNFELKPDKFDLNYKISVDTEDVSYSKNDALAKKIDKLDSYEIANSNYYVNYSIPNIFKMTSFDSKSGSFVYKEGNNRIILNTYIYNFNIYDYIDSTKNSGSIYSDYDYLKKDTAKYKNFVDGINEFNIGNYNGYIYKVSYTNTGTIKNDIDAYIIAIELNKNHILRIKVEGTNIKVPRELLNNIKINSIKNYSSYVTRNVDNGNMLIELKRFINSDYDKYELLKIKLPEKYREIDKQNNIYSDRYFGLNYDSNNEVYQYNIHYKISSLTKDSEIDLVNSNMNSYKTYGEVKELSFLGEREINGKNYSLYNASYYKKGSLYNSSDDSVIYKINEKILINELSDGGCVVIIIDGNDIEVDDTLLNEITSIEISTELLNNGKR